MKKLKISKKKVSIILIIFVIVVILITVVFVVEEARNKNHVEEVDNSEFTWDQTPEWAVPYDPPPDYNRKLDLNNFESIKKGDNFEEIVSVVGNPNRISGSGVSIFDYRLEDNSYVQLNFFADFSNLQVMVHVQKDGTIKNLLDD
ncbi:MAG TPA: hypothetical protein ENI23_03050 [bacterium]|nr:hypothetical protein [bacterium]